MIGSPRRTAGVLAVVALAGLALTAGGCINYGHVTPRRLDEGLVVILPGTEGPGVLNVSVRKGLEDAGLRYAMEIYDWAQLRPGVTYAFDEGASRGRAEEIALRIQQYRRDYPHRPVFVIGHSGGAAIGIFAAEEMADEKPLTGLVAMAAPLSPTYDLTEAIAGSGGNFVHTYSAGDVFLRGLVTVGRNFDGTRGRTAGQQGFERPEDATATRREAYEQFEQIRWEPSMLPEGHLGGHLGWASPIWVEQRIAPLLRQWASRRSGAE